MDRPQRVVLELHPCHGLWCTTVQCTLGSWAGLGWEEGKQSRGEGKGPRFMGRGWWVPWGFALADGVMEMLSPCLPKAVWARQRLASL